MFRSNIPTLAFWLSLTAAGNAAEVDARAARVMLSAWMCSEYAEIKGDEAESERLFLLGYGAGKQFLAAAKAGTITPEERHSTVPMVLQWMMSGPTPEFILGRMYESATSDAFDKVTAKNANGFPLEVKDWITDDKLKTSIAETKFVQANCEIIK
jgi:hypothetical protein